MECFNMYVYIAIIAVSVVALNKNRQRVMAWIWGILAPAFSAEFGELKSALFKSLTDIKSKNPELRKENSIRLLEIGVGTGCNFKYYPKGTRLVTVDPNPHFASYYNENRKEFEHIQSEEFIVTTGDKMDTIESNSIDVVVTTLVLCSIENLEPTMKEILRVLAPGGKHYMLEHVRETNKKHWIRIFFQQFLSRTGIIGLFFDGCSVIRDILPDVEKAGFASVEREYLDPPGPLMTQLDRPILSAIATK